MQQSPKHTANKFGSLILSNASTPSQKQQTPNEKAFHFSHNQYIRPSLDSQLSTSSGSPNMSPLHSRTGSYHDTGDFLDQPNARFPILVQNKFAKLQTKLKAAKRREQDIKSADAPVNEEKEESEKEIHFLKKLPVVEDAEEFNVKKTHLNRLRGRDMFNRELSRCKSTEASFFLDSVQEDKDEDDFNLFKQRKKIDEWNMEDHNEFNQNDRSATERKPRRKYSLQFGPQESIQEEQEKILIPHFQSLFSTPHTGSNSSYHGSLHSSPGPKLRVDEIDFKDRKSKTKDEDDGEVIDPIMEETEERNMQVVDNKEYQAAKHKLNEEREFLKKVINYDRGEMIDENNSSFSKMNSERDYSYVGSGVIEEIIEEDRNESLQN